MSTRILSRRRVVLGGAALTLAGCLVCTPLIATATSPRPVDGVWRTDGYGTIVAIDNGIAKQYAVTAVSCTPGPVGTQAGPPRRDGTVRFLGPERSYTVRAHGRRGVLHLEGSVGDQNLRRLETLPERCSTTRDDPLSAFDEFWTTYKENYPFFAAKGIDWNAVRDRYRPRVRPGMTNDELYDLFVEMIEPLGDLHTGVENGDERFTGHRPGTTIPDLELENRVRPYIVERDLGGRPLTSYGNDLIGYADLPGRIGYLRIILFIGYGDGTYEGELKGLDQALDAIFTAQRVRSLKGLMIDLRVNGGGSDEFGLRLASRLTGQPYVAYLKRARNDPEQPSQFTHLQPALVRPAAGPQFTGPIAILIGGSTVSAGETFTEAMMGRSPRPVRVGQNTQGVFSDTLERTLPNGLRYVLPNEEFRTPDSRTFDGPGIPPHHRVPVFTEEEFAQHRDSAFDLARRLLG